MSKGQSTTCSYIRYSTMFLEINPHAYNTNVIRLWWNFVSFCSHILKLHRSPSSETRSTFNQSAACLQFGVCMHDGPPDEKLQKSQLFPSFAPQCRSAAARLQTRAAIRCMGATSLLPSWTGYTCVSENTHAREGRIRHVLGGSHLESKNMCQARTVVAWCGWSTWRWWQHSCPMMYWWFCGNVLLFSFIY
jgi:hypothetical protein